MRLLFAGLLCATVAAACSDGTSPKVPPPVTSTTLALGNLHTCGLTSGAAYCWGYNVQGQLGVGDTAQRTTPVAILGGLTFASLIAGEFQTCGLTSGGAAYCWGFNRDGELGDGSTGNRTAPVAVQGGLTFTSLRAGGDGASLCGLTSGGVAYCWGYNGDGELGDGSTTFRTAPVAVSGGLRFASLALGGSHTCALTSGGAAYCWGYNNIGQLGIGAADTILHTTPVAVAGGHTFASLTAGDRHTCALTSAGTAYCWGWNFAGQLGHGDTVAAATPVLVAGGITFASLTAPTGGHFVCGLTSGGAAYCWGSDRYGQLGIGAADTIPHTTPVAVLGGNTFARLAPGAVFTCGVTSGGAAYCWGDNTHGQLGDGSTTQRTTPVAVAGGLTFRSRSAADDRTNGLTSRGGL